MSKIANAFKGGNGKAFIPFITCGDQIGRASCRERV